MADPNDVVGHKTLRREDGSFYHEPLLRSEGEALFAQVEANERRRVEQMPDEQTAIRALFDAYVLLKDFGWREAVYCPKDRSEFLVIEAGSTGQHRCMYEGEWPTGKWWIVEDGDMSPSRPVLFKPIPATPEQAP